MAKKIKLRSQKIGWIVNLANLFRLIEKAGGQLQVVGGAVRDTLLDRPVHDIDFATNLTPKQVTEACQKAGLKVVPTGIEFGTVTVILDHEGYQITTLRRDIETDGRHTKVTYTDNWEKDAARRDFTINALYMNKNGEVTDYHNGLEDLKLKRLEFIGDPSARIKEDVLRILRAYRFSAELGFEIEDRAVDACQTLANLLPSLSSERVWLELSRLFKTKAAGLVWERMIDQGIAQYVLPEATNTERLKNFCKNHTGNEIAAIVAALNKNVDMNLTAKKLRLSRNEAKQMENIKYCITHLKEGQINKSLYYYGREATRGALTILKAEAYEIPDDYTFKIDTWANPIFPLRGQDIKKINISEGEEIGKILKVIEAWWLKGDCKPDHQACINKAKEEIAALLKE